MQKIINKPDEVVDEMVEGYVKAYSDIVKKPTIPEYSNTQTHQKKTK